MTKLKQELVWLKEVDSVSLQSSIKDLDIAYQHFFRRAKQGDKKCGFPKFKNKKDNRKSYKTKATRNNIKINDKHIQLPKLGLVKCSISKQIEGQSLIIVDRFFPSSQLCQCGYKNVDVKDLSIRYWICPECGGKHDRDANAAINILNEGLRLLDIKQAS